MQGNFSDITKELVDLAEVCRQNGTIDSELYTKYDVKRGLRDINGKGVLTGLTEVSKIQSYTLVDCEMVPCEGKLYYHGVDIEDIVSGFIKEKRFGYEETLYLLLFGKLPRQEQLEQLNQLLAEYRSLPTSFVRDIIMKAPSRDMMNALARSVLTLYAYDDRADDTSLPNVLRQCLQLTALVPVISVYGYQAYRHYHDGQSLFIHVPKPEHGGGNNSTFTTHVVTSSGTDTYSCIAASLGSLKGPKHGGANIKVVKMFEDMKQKVSDWKNEEEIKQYLRDLLDKKAFDHQGLIYGMGHAVYSISDPRAKIFRQFVEKLSIEKNRTEEYELYSMVERLAPEVIAQERKIYKGVSANVDFYSGFVYSMLDLPTELYTPIFAIARMAGWSAHRMEELINQGKIIRPAYKCVAKPQPYVPMAERD